MKISNHKKPRQNLILAILFFLCFGNLSFGQEKINIYATAGFPETINIGARFQLEQKQIGIGFGAFPSSHGGLFSVSGDFFYHYGGTSKLSDRRPWYFKTGLNYIYGESENNINKSLFLNTRVGREFNISKKTGISIDTGLAFLLLYDEVIKNNLMIGT